MNNDQWDFSFDDILGDFGIGSEDASVSVPEEAAAPVPEAEPQSVPEEELSEEDSFFRDFGGGEIREATVTPGPDAETVPDHEPEPESVCEPEAEPETEPEDGDGFVFVPAAEAASAPKRGPKAQPKNGRKPASESQKKSPQARRADAKRREAAAKERSKERREAAKRAEKRDRFEEKERAREEREREKELAAETKRQEKQARLAATVHERRQLKIALIVFGIVVAAIAAATIIAGRKVTFSGKNYPNVYVNSVYVGNMDRGQTAQTLIDNDWEERANRNLKVTTVGGVSFEVSPASTGILMTLDEAVNAAQSFGRTRGILSNLYSYCENIFRPADVNEIDRTENYEYIDSCIAAGEAQISAVLGDSEYTLDREAGELRLVKGYGSMKLNTAELYDSIVTAIREGWTELDFRQMSKEPVMPDFEAILTELHAEPKDAEYKDDGSFEVIPEVVGCNFSVDQARQLWEQAGPAETVSVPADISWPATTAEMLESRLYHDMLGAMTTRYTNSGENRCSNLRLATSKIDGLILYPGDEFSYNDVVGARTEEAGFLPAPAYAGLGEDGVKDEIGGGACQVSSTLYSATVFAFLDTVERHNHIYPVNYMQLGTDATVTIPTDGGNVMDFKFRNSKNYPIRIVGYCNESEEEKTITFEIWGTLEEGDYMPVEFDNTWNWQFDYDRCIDAPYADRQGYKIKLTHENYVFADELGNGSRTLTHREIYDTEGNQVVDEIINTMISTGYAMDTYYEHP